MRTVSAGVAIVSALLLGACAVYPVAQAPALPSGQGPMVADNPPVYSPSRQAPVYESGPAYSRSRQAEAQVQYGVVGAIQPLVERRPAGVSTGAGAVIGGIAGAVIGRQFGNSSDGRANGTILGALGGVIVGDQIERQQASRSIIRVSVNLERGGTRSFDFSDVGDLRIGDRVRVEGNQLYRL